MEFNLILIGVEREAANRLSVAGRTFGHTVTQAASPTEIPTDKEPNRAAIIPYFGPDTLLRSINALNRRNVRNVVALMTTKDGTAVADAFRAGASDVILGDTAEVELKRCLTYLTARDMRRREPMDVRPLQDVERDAISSALEACRGQVSLTARRLGIGRSTLYRKIEQYALVQERPQS